MAKAQPAEPSLEATETAPAIPVLQPFASVRGDPPSIAPIRSSSLFGLQSPNTDHLRLASNGDEPDSHELISPWSQVRVPPSLPTTLA